MSSKQELLEQIVGLRAAQTGAVSPRERTRLESLSVAQLEAELSQLQSAARQRYVDDALVPIRSQVQRSVEAAHQRKLAQVQEERIRQIFFFRHSDLENIQANWNAIRERASTLVDDGNVT